MKLFLLVLLLSGRTEAVPATSDIGERVTTEQSDGVVVRAAWTPTKDQILAFEQVLSEHVRKAPLAVAPVGRELPKFKRQYYGLKKHGRREIMAVGYHQSTDIVASDRWLKLPVTVAGGGEYYFTFRYDVVEKKIVSGGVNAPK